MRAKDQAKIETISKLTKKIQLETIESENSGMIILIMNSHAMMAIEMYDEKLTEKLGSFVDLLNALEQGNFKDENGVLLKDTLTYQNLKKRISE